MVGKSATGRWWICVLEQTLGTLALMISHGENLDHTDDYIEHLTSTVRIESPTSSRIDLCRQGAVPEA